jgi:deoxyribonuclease V
MSSSTIQKETGKMRIDSLKKIQQDIAQHIKLIPLDTPIKYIAGFGCATQGKDMTCAVAILSYPELQLIEHKILKKPAPMQYIPGFRAFREGKLILELYYQLEYEPDVLLVPGHGIAHPVQCGLATFVGHELAKPTIGIAKNLMEGATIQDNSIIMHNKVRGKVVKTKEHAKELYVSPGHLVTIEQAEDIVLQTVKPPHKMPEPIHVALRLAKKMKKN